MHHEYYNRPTSMTLNAEESKIVREIDEEEIIQYLSMLVSIPSIFGSEHRISEQIADDLRGFGFTIETVPVPDCGPCVVGVSSRTDNPHAALPVLVFNGHMDTVPVCDGWTRDPFSPTVEQGKLYGLGSVDMKGGLAAIIMAGKALLSSGVSLKRDFALHAVSDEEGWSRGTATLIDRGFYNGTDYCIVGEPSGLNQLRNARRGRCLLDITIRGKSAHGAQPERGINAILDAGKVISVLGSLPDSADSRIVDFELKRLKTSSCILKINGGSDALSVPDNCIIRLDRHVLPGTALFKEIAEIRAFLKERLDEDTFNRTRVEFSPRPGGSSNYEGYETDPRSPLVRVISNVSRNFGYEPPLVAGLSVADDCLIAARCRIPIVSYGPDGDTSTRATGRDHESDEFVLTKQVLDATKIYAVSAYRILNGK